MIPLTYGTCASDYLFDKACSRIGCLQYVASAPVWVIQHVQETFGGAGLRCSFLPDIVAAAS